MQADSRFQKVVGYQINNPNLEVREAMKLADCSLREREVKAKYMMVLRLLNKTKKDDFCDASCTSINHREQVK